MSGTSSSSRPSFPERAVITAGMPYGNKHLHFGHVGGVFIPADVYARFLRDRIGKENVIFVSGTDCYGSPIEEGYRKAQASGYDKSIYDYVEEFHKSQKETLEAYEVSCDLYTGSSLEPARTPHINLSEEILNRLYELGELETRSSKQFYDAKFNMFLNGRQVEGYCPVQGCKSTKAYADECELGHQYEPEDLIKPISTISHETPEMREVTNYYFKLPEHRDFIIENTKRLADDPEIRPLVPQTIEGFLQEPSIYIKNELEPDYLAIKNQLPEHKFVEAEAGKQSFEIIFNNFEARDSAREVLSSNNIRFRTGKTLLPLRMTGNVKWGIPIPSLPGAEDLTVWVWMESLWAPISFTQTVLQQNLGTNRYSSDDWKDWWASEDAQVYQFIGEDNIYFYGVAQPPMFEALDWGLKATQLIANHHILYLGKKASSSSNQKPPTAAKLLDSYNPEQLRAHWINLGLDKKSVSFAPKAFDPDMQITEDMDDKQKQAINRQADPALKESALLTNIFNRLARSCFYGAQKHLDNKLPQGELDYDLVDELSETIMGYEQAMSKFEFTTVFEIVENLIRNANKRWGTESKAANSLENDHFAQKEMEQALLHAFNALRVATVLMHPIVPRGCEKIQEYLNIDAEDFFSWEHIFKPLDEFLLDLRIKIKDHELKELPPRTDFFEKHPSQYK